ncbi:hypothetical protein ACFVXG_28865 [Kitasatospora sp. NPDC058162]|uniref:hypothetical protein n=1 Tax=Kitasatospora sp. NPDC058162 TaxID=3346362 RepID=UPI0036D85A59
MEDVPQGGAGGVPLDDTDQKHPIHPPGSRSETEADEEEGEATTAEPSRSRHLAPAETHGGPDEQPDESGGRPARAEPHSTTERQGP